MSTLKELREAVVEAVATLDEADGSRISTAEAIDAAREVLADVYGDNFETDVSQFLGEPDDETDDDED